MESKKVVLSFLDALNAEDFTKARTYITDHLYFDGVMGKRNGGNIYIEDMKKMLFKYDIQQVFEEGNTVCVVYDINMSGKTIFTIGLYELEDDKIKKIRVVFDPRPIL